MITLYLYAEIWRGINNVFKTEFLEKLRYSTVSPKHSITLACTSAIACDKILLKVGVAPVSIASLHPIIGGVKSRN